MQNPDARRRGIVAALIAIGVIAVLAIAMLSRGGGKTTPVEPTQIAQNQNTTNGQSTVPPPQGAGGVELGSMIIAAYQCPERSTADSDCKNAGAVELTKFSMTLPDGQVVDLANAERMEDGSYQWLNIPIGTYTLPSANFAGPAGLSVRNIAGPAEPIADGWTIKNADPNQPVVIDILYAPAEGSPAAG